MTLTFEKRIKLEKDFIYFANEYRYRKYKQYELRSNNIQDIYTIDYKLLLIADEKVIAWADFEGREKLKNPKPLRTFKSIHVPVESITSVYRETYDSISNKIEYYKSHPNNSFHISWDYKECEGFLILGKDIIESPIVETRNGVRNKIFHNYNVSMNKVIRINVITIIEKMIEKLKG